jgi:hypothetical protein
MNFGNIFRTFGPRVLGVLAGWGATRISEATGIAVDPASLIAIGTFVYSGVHRATSAVVNKGDAATGRVAAAENTASTFGSAVVVPPPTK